MRIKLLEPVQSLCLKAGDVVECHEVMAHNLIQNGMAQEVKPAKKESKE